MLAVIFQYSVDSFSRAASVFFVKKLIENWFLNKIFIISVEILSNGLASVPVFIHMGFGEEEGEETFCSRCNSSVISLKRPID